MVNVRSATILRRGAAGPVLMRHGLLLRTVSRFCFGLLILLIAQSAVVANELPETTDGINTDGNGAVAVGVADVVADGDAEALSHARRAIQAGGPQENPGPLIVIDTDPGVDDAAALAALISLVDGPDIQGIVTVYGNATARDGANTVLNLLAQAGRVDIPVIVGMDGPYPSVGVGLHGPDGLWYQNQQNPQDVDSLSSRPLRFYCKPPSGNWQGTTLLALGPLTNVAAAVERCPRVMRTFEQIISLGGAKVGGNFTPVAEYNYWQDADAADTVAAFAAPDRAGEPPSVALTIVPFDAFSQLGFGQELIDQLDEEGNDVIRFVLPALQIYKDVQEANGIQPSLPDVVAAALLLDPSVGSSQTALLKVMHPDQGIRPSLPDVAAVPPHVRGSEDARQVRGQTVVGLGVNERLTMIADERELAEFALKSVTDPDFDILGAIGAILARDPDNVQFTTSIDSARILDGFIAAVTTPVVAAAAELRAPQKMTDSEETIYLPFITDR